MKLSEIGIRLLGVSLSLLMGGTFFSVASISLGTFPDLCLKLAGILLIIGGTLTSIFFGLGEY